MSTVPNIVHTRWCDPDQHDHDDLDTAEQPSEFVCVDCGATFGWDESPSDQRCAHCADINEWRQGGAT